MTTTTVYNRQDGSEVVLKTNPGAPPMVFLNGVIQSPSDYRVVGKSVIFGEKYDWQPHKLWRPKRVNGRWYWPGDRVYRRWVPSPGGGFWRYGDEFDLLRC